MKFDKLVRDKIPEIIEKNGSIAIIRTLTDEEYEVYLEKKLDEEVAEFHESKSIDELADIQEVFNALCRAYGYSVSEVYQKVAEKALARGCFYDKILLIETIDKEEPSI